MAFGNVLEHFIRRHVAELSAQRIFLPSLGNRFPFLFDTNNTSSLIHQSLLALLLALGGARDVGLKYLVGLALLLSSRCL